MLVGESIETLWLSAGWPARQTIPTLQSLRGRFYSWFGWHTRSMKLKFGPLFIVYSLIFIGAQVAMELRNMYFTRFLFIIHCTILAKSSTFVGRLYATFIHHTWSVWSHGAKIIDIFTARRYCIICSGRVSVRPSVLPSVHHKRALYQSS